MVTDEPKIDQVFKKEVDTWAQGEEEASKAELVGDFFFHIP